MSPRVAAGVLAGAAILAVASLGGTTGAPEARSSAVTVDSGVTTESAFVTATSWLDTANVAALSAEDAGELRVARTWTSVRQARSKAADLEAVLLPGDTVVADSLRRGWYRVALEGEVIGYVHRSTLTALPSPAASASTDTPGVPPQARPRPSPR